MFNEHERIDEANCISDVILLKNSTVATRAVKAVPERGPKKSVIDFAKALNYYLGQPSEVVARRQTRALFLLEFGFCRLNNEFRRIYLLQQHKTNVRNSSLWYTVDAETEPSSECFLIRKLQDRCKIIFTLFITTP